MAEQASPAKANEASPSPAACEGTRGVSRNATVIAAGSTTKVHRAGNHRSIVAKSSRPHVTIPQKNVNKKQMLIDSIIAIL